MDLAGLTSDDLWTMSTAALCAVACAIPGCFLYLKRLSLLGDALSHAILPGIAIAFFISGTRALGAMFIGALVAGLLTALLSIGIRRWGRVPEDAALGVVFTSFFALGVVLISIAARNVDLDPGCVLYGALEFVPFDTVALWGVEVPRAFLALSVVCLVTFALVTIFYKELVLVSFDPALASALGFSSGALTTGLLVVVSGTVVASFEAVGSILVVTILVAPAATAHLLTERMPWFLANAVLFAISSAVFGYLGALHFNTSVAGMISVVACLQCLLAAVLSPSHGALAALSRRVRFSLSVHQEDILGSLYRGEERSQAIPTALSPRAIRSALKLSPYNVWYYLALGQLYFGGKVSSKDSALMLTHTGRTDGERVVRGHRLWETYLDKTLKLPLDHLHEPSDRVEHYLNAKLRTELAQELGTGRDPHGTAIPLKEKEPPS